MKAQVIALAPGMNGRPAGRAARPSILSLIATWRRVARERRQLLDVEPRMLADMGLTADDVRREAARPFWDLGPTR